MTTKKLKTGLWVRQSIVRGVTRIEVFDTEEESKKNKLKNYFK